MSKYFTNFNKASDLTIGTPVSAGEDRAYFPYFAALDADILDISETPAYDPATAIGAITTDGRLLHKAGLVDYGRRAAPGALDLVACSAIDENPEMIRIMPMKKDAVEFVDVDRGDSGSSKIGIARSAAAIILSSFSRDYEREVYILGYTTDRANADFSTTVDRKPLGRPVTTAHRKYLSDRMSVVRFGFGKVVRCSLLEVDGDGSLITKRYA